MAEHKKQFVFVHIPKTAGTTFALILMHQFSWKAKLSFYPPRSRADYQKISSEQKERYDLVYGHIGFDEQNLKRGTEYYTFLREPRERLLSSYKHIKSNADQLVGKQKELMNKSLKEILKNGQAKNMDNAMTRYLSGTLDKNYLEVNEEDVQKAIRNFDTNFKVFGLTEHFDESLVWLSDHMKWQPLYYVKENKSSYKIDMQELDEETEALILKCNQHDNVLYDHALVRFRRMLGENTEMMSKGLKRLKEGNEKNKSKIALRNKVYQLYYSSLKKIN